MSHPMQGLPSPAAHSLLQDDPMHPALILTFPVTPANVLHSVKSLMAARRKTDSKRFGRGFVSNQFSGKKHLKQKCSSPFSQKRSCLGRVYASQTNAYGSPVKTENPSQEQTAASSSSSCTYIHVPAAHEETAHWIYHRFEELMPLTFCASALGAPAPLEQLVLSLSLSQNSKR